MPYGLWLRVASHTYIYTAIDTKMCPSHCGEIIASAFLHTVWLDLSVCQSYFRVGVFCKHICAKVPGVEPTTVQLSRLGGQKK